MPRLALESLTPNQLFILFVAGVLAVYCSTVFPISRILGFAGLGSALAAAYFATSYPIHFPGFICLAAAAVLYGIELRCKINYAAGLVAAVLLPIGFVLLFSGPQEIAPALAIPLGLILGTATAILCCSAKRARLNKILDLSK